MEQLSRFCLRTHEFSDAKARLSDVMSAVVHDHVPTVVRRHRGKEQMLLMDVESLRPVLDNFPFSTRASVSDGEFILRQPELGLISGGESFDEAAEELEELVAAHASQFFERLDFYRHTDRIRELPYLLRLVLAPQEEWRDILMPPTAAQAHAEPMVTPQGDVA